MKLIFKKGIEIAGASLPIVPRSNYYLIYCNREGGKFENPGLEIWGRWGMPTLFSAPLYAFAGEDPERPGLL